MFQKEEVMEKDQMEKMFVSLMSNKEERERIFEEMRKEGLSQEHRVVRMEPTGPVKLEQVFPMYDPTGVLSEVCAMLNQEKGTKEQQDKAKELFEKRQCDFCYVKDPISSLPPGMKWVSPIGKNGIMYEKADLFEECRNERAGSCLALLASYEHLLDFKAPIRKD